MENIRLARQELGLCRLEEADVSRADKRQAGMGSELSLCGSHSSASALQFLHERSISHLDLKPQNILLSSLEKPHLKLAGLCLKQQG